MYGRFARSPSELPLFAWNPKGIGKNEALRLKISLKAVHGSFAAVGFLYLMPANDRLCGVGPIRAHDRHSLSWRALSITLLHSIFLLFLIRLLPAGLASYRLSEKLQNGRIAIWIGEGFDWSVLQAQLLRFNALLA